MFDMDGIDMAEVDCSVILQTIAALGSALAAILALCVSYRNYSFQRNLLLKKDVVERIQVVLQDLHYLNTFMYQEECGPPDGAIEAFPNRVSEVKAKVIAMSIILSAPSREKAKEIINALNGLSVAAIANTPGILDGQIVLLQNIYSMELT